MPVSMGKVRTVPMMMTIMFEVVLGQVAKCDHDFMYVNTGNYIREVMLKFLLHGKSVRSQYYRIHCLN